MPESYGYDICRQIRAVEQGATIQILVFTQRHDTEAVDQAVMAGATDFTEPCSLYEIHR